jgi:hypothetical protein
MVRLLLFLAHQWRMLVAVVPVKVLMVAQERLDLGDLVVVVTAVMAAVAATGLVMELRGLQILGAAVAARGAAVA